MNTRSECIKIVSNLAIFHNCKISFKEEDGYSILSTIKDGIITFPIYQEALLILYELDDKERIIDFLLSLYMIDNDEYELCDELLSELEEKGLPVCTDSDELYSSIFIKQLFLLFHEYGHFLFAIRDDVKKRFYEGMNRIGNNMVDRQSLDYSEYEIIVNLIKKYDKNISNDSAYRDLLLNTNYIEKNQAYFSKSHNIEESAADLFALFFLKNILENNNINKTHSETKKCVLEAALFVGGLTNFKELLRFRGENDDENFYRFVFDPKLKMSVNQNRYATLATFIDDFFNAEPFDILDLFLEIVAKPFICMRTNEAKYEKYIDAWLKGNDKSINLEIREKLHKRIMDYSNSLLSLYGQ